MRGVLCFQWTKWEINGCVYLADVFLVWMGKRRIPSIIFLVESNGY